MAGMIQLLGAIGWGLLACGSITHVMHHRRLRQLLAMHFDRERLPAALLTLVEVVLTIALPATLLTQVPSLRWFALAALVLAVGFMAWIARLLLTGSELPCACSFSAAPTTIWSFLRSVCVGLVGFYLLVDASAAAVADTSSQVATLAVGWAVASVIFVAPEAFVWPAASRALMARVQAHAGQGTTAPS